MITQPVKRTTWHYESTYNGSSVGHRRWSFQHTAQCFDWNILQTRYGMTNLHFSPFLYKFCLSINFRTTCIDKPNLYGFSGTCRKEHLHSSRCGSVAALHSSSSSVHTSHYRQCWCLCSLQSASHTPPFYFFIVEETNQSRFVKFRFRFMICAHETLNHLQEKEKKVVIVIQVWISLCFVTVSKSISSTL